MNRESWSALLRNGASESTPLRLDFFFRAPSEAAAEKLASTLREQTDYAVSIDTDGSPEKWTVIGNTRPTSVSLTVLDQWVDWMLIAGIEWGCVFDGWGTDVSSA